MELYNKGGCKSLHNSASYPATGICQRATYGITTSSDIVRLYPNGSAVLELFSDASCGINDDATIRPTGSEISNHTCSIGTTLGGKIYSSMSPTNNSSSTSFNENSSTNDTTPSTTETSRSSTGLSTGGIIGIVIGSIMIVLLVVVVFVWWRRSKSKQWALSDEVENPADHQCDDSKLNPSYMSDTTERSTVAEVGSSTQHRENFGVGRVWDDEAIVAVRIPRNKVLVHELISRDGYAEVFLTANSWLSSHYYHKHG